MENKQTNKQTNVIPNRNLQNDCLATGNTSSITGGLMVDEDNVTVWVDSYTKVLVTLNGLTVQDVEGAHWLEQPDGRLAFQRGLTEQEKSPGLKKYRAFAVLKDFCMFIICC